MRGKFRQIHVNFLRECGQKDRRDPRRSARKDVLATLLYAHCDIAILSRLSLRRVSLLVASLSLSLASPFNKTSIWHRVRLEWKNLSVGSHHRIRQWPGRRKIAIQFWSSMYRAIYICIAARVSVASMFNRRAFRNVWSYRDWVRKQNAKISSCNKDRRILYATHERKNILIGPWTGLRVRNDRAVGIFVDRFIDYSALIAERSYEKLAHFARGEDYLSCMTNG